MVATAPMTAFIGPNPSVDTAGSSGGAVMEAPSAVPLRSLPGTGGRQQLKAINTSGWHVPLDASALSPTFLASPTFSPDR